MPFDELQPVVVLPCQMPYFDRPRGDNQILLNLFHDFRAGNQKALARAYEVMHEIAAKLITQFCERNKRLLLLSAADRWEKAHNAATYIVMQYVERGDFYIKKSVVAYLYKRVQFELFYHRKVDKIVDFVDFSELKI